MLNFTSRGSTWQVAAEAYADEVVGWQGPPLPEG